MNGPLKWHGGKRYLANKIIALFPPRCKNPNKPSAADPGWLHYVEPYFGGGSVLLANDPEGISEVVNDINSDLTNLWCVLQSPKAFKEFHRVLSVTPFCKYEFDWSQDYLIFPPTTHDVMHAIAFFIRCRQSLAGRMKGFSGITRTRTRRGMNNEVSAWLSAIEGLPMVRERMRRVLILTDKALNVIKSQDGKRTLFYLDPPYLHETRKTTGEYEHEMTRKDHIKLLNVLCKVQGRFLLSGYRSDLYDKYARIFEWKRHEFEIANHAAGGKNKRRMIECVWTNY